MKNLTAKDAVMTVTIDIAGDKESFFFYKGQDYSELINAINSIQLKTGDN